MPNLTIYVPDELAERLKDRDLNVSRTCQAALAREVEQEARRKRGGPRGRGGDRSADRQRQAA